MVLYTQQQKCMKRTYIPNVNQTVGWNPASASGQDSVALGELMGVVAPSNFPREPIPLVPEGGAASGVPPLHRVFATDTILAGPGRSWSHTPPSVVAGFFLCFPL